MKKMDIEDTLRIVSTQLEQFQDMKKIAEETDSPFMRAEAIGGIIALESLTDRLNRYIKSKDMTTPRHTVNADSVKVIEATHNQWAKNGATK